MRTNFWMWLIFGWMVATVIFGFGDLIDVNSETSGSLNTLLQFNVLTILNCGLGGWTVPIPVVNVDFWAAAGNVMSWNFSVFYGDWNFVRWIGLIAAGGGMFGLVTTVGPMMINVLIALGSISALFGAITIGARLLGC